MASMTIRNIPEEAKLRFRQIAAAHGRSMEEHLRQMVIEAGFDDGRTGKGVSDVTQSFKHFEPEPFVSSGSPVIDTLLKSWRGLEFEAPVREPMDFSDVFDPEDYL